MITTSLIELDQTSWSPTVSVSLHVWVEIIVFQQRAHNTNQQTDTEICLDFRPPMDMSITILNLAVISQHQLKIFRAPAESE